MTAYNLVWTSQYGTEVIDEADDRKTAQYLRREYLLAFGEGSIVIKRVHNRCAVQTCDVAISVARSLCSDCEADRG
jgi:hypothetical protein